MIEYGQFKSHSGLYLPWKIDCDSFTDEDLASFAKIISDHFKFRDVYGIPRGGTRLAQECRKFITPSSKTLLIVDDVFTTGKSMQEAKDTWKEEYQSISGVVLFDRAVVGLPYWIDSIFMVSHWKYSINE